MGGTEDPSGTYPIDCVFDCSLNCEGKECGSDGCGGTCGAGSCGDGEVCVEGICCTRDCDGKECGADGCGGWCGHCPSYEQIVCEDGLCVEGYGCADTLTPGCPGCACEECVCSYYPSCCTGEWDGGCAWACENECGGCAPCVPSCEGKVCGSDGCGGSCGVCQEGYGCALGECCEQSCDGKECGDDGYWGVCGVCPSGAVCTDEFVCEQEYGCQPTSTGGCGGCVCEYCVCEFDPYCCDVEWDGWCVHECEESCGGCGPYVCVGSCEDVECGDDGCGESCGECGSGEECYQGHCCVPSCEGKCGGSDGCGGSCGPEQCGYGSYCEGGICLTLCANECEGKQCGEGKCGGLCTFDSNGRCTNKSHVCIEGLCYDDCAGIPGVGCCHEGASYHCGYSEYSTIKIDECTWGGEATHCGWSPDYDPIEEVDSGTYACSHTGEDPSGTYPLECGQFTCKAPSCQNKECGPDGCGGTCGDCSEGYRCTLEGTCCEQACEGKECGRDGCGGFCGECPLGMRCTDSFQCEQCEGDPCAGLECGPDGCGGWCGKCPDEDSRCVGGVCMSDCTGLSPKGCCTGEWAVQCDSDDGDLYVKPCPPSQNYCGWSEAEERYTCLTDGGADPSGQYPKECFAECVPACWFKECGPDGCGGTCGECPEGEECVSGACVSDAEPSPDATAELQETINETITATEIVSEANAPVDGLSDQASDAESGDEPHKKHDDGCCSLSEAPSTAGSASATSLLVLCLVMLTLVALARRL